MGDAERTTTEQAWEDFPMPAYFMLDVWLATNCLINLPLSEREGVLAGVDAIMDEELEGVDV